MTANFQIKSNDNFIQKNGESKNESKKGSFFSKSRRFPFHKWTKHENSPSLRKILFDNLKRSVEQLLIQKCEPVF